MEIKTLTLIKVNFQGNEVIIPILENANMNFEKANIIYRALEKEITLEISKQTLWQYISSIEDLKSFNKSFYHEGKEKKQKYLEIFEQDFDNLKYIDTFFGVVSRPTEKTDIIPVIVKQGLNKFINVNDTQLPILKIVKGKEI